MSFKEKNEEEILKQIGESIRGSRIASNLTLNELSNKSEINATTLSKIENGKRDDFKIEDFIEIGKKADLSERKVKNILNKITNVVYSWKTYFEEARVPCELIQMVDGKLRLHLFD